MYKRIILYKSKERMDAIIRILALVGMVTIIIYLIFKLWAYYTAVSERRRKAAIRPPLDYMNNIGIKCPDYWVYAGTDANGNYKCVNKFNLDVADTAKCYTGNNAEKTFIFKALGSDKNWETMTEDEKTSFVTNEAPSGGSSRCKWISDCKGVWLGVQNICSKPSDSITN